MQNNINDNEYVFKSIVVYGNQLGRTVDMPTINFDVSKMSEYEFPKDGVYGSLVVLPDGSEKFGVSIIGSIPTIKNANNKNFETHIIDLNQNLYGKEVTIKIVKYIREIKKFNSLEEVKTQVDKDKRWYIV